MNLIYYYYDLFLEARMIFQLHAILSLLCGLAYLLFELDSWRIRMVYLPLSILILVRLIHHWVHLSYRKYSDVLGTILIFNWFENWMYILSNLRADCDNLFSLLDSLRRFRNMVVLILRGSYKLKILLAIN